MKIKQRRQLEMAEGEMTPMIDMTFQLIAFFMVLINFTEVEQNRDIKLPVSELAQPPEEGYDDVLTLQVTKEETVLFAGDEHPIEGVAGPLLREAQIIDAYDDKTLADVTVIIRADAAVKVGKVQRVIQLCQEAEFETFALRGKQSNEGAFVTDRKIP